jgi:hypothetical protein
MIRVVNIITFLMLAMFLALELSAAAHARAVPFSGPKGDHDAAALWVDISPIVDGTQAQARELAGLICEKLDEGASEGQLIAAGAKGDSSRVDGLALVVHAAEWHFCPTYY